MGEVGAQKIQILNPVLTALRHLTWTQLLIPVWLAEHHAENSTGVLQH